MNIIWSRIGWKPPPYITGFRVLLGTILLTPLITFEIQERCNKEPFINEGMFTRVEIHRAIGDKGKKKVQSVSLDICKKINYPDFEEVIVYDSRGKELFRTKDTEEYASRREKLMENLPMHAWFDFNELKGEIPEVDIYQNEYNHPTPATLVSSSSPWTSHNKCIYLGRINPKKSTFLELNREIYKHPSQIRIWWWKHLVRTGKTDLASQRIVDWLTAYSFKRRLQRDDWK